MFSIPFSLSRSIGISKPASEVYAFLVDFSNWPSWSPWLCQEPGCPVSIEGKPGQEGHSQHWQGKHIGEGKMHIAKHEASKSIEYSMVFLKPWKSKSEVKFKLEVGESPDETRVSWEMDSTLPIFLFWMKKMMTAWVGMDYERGLGMLKDRLESGSVLSKVESKGIVDQGAFYFVGLRSTCDLEQVGPSMEKDFSEIKNKVGESKPDFSISFYHDYDMVKKSCDYTAAFCFLKDPDKAIDGEHFVRGHIPAHKALQVNHFGPYKYLGNAWAALMSHSRSQRLKRKKQIDMYEVYKKMPGEVEDGKIETHLFFPIK